MTIRAILFDLDNTLYAHSSGVMQLIDRRIGEFLEQRLGMQEQEARTLRRHYYATYGTTLRGLQQHHAQIEAEEFLQFVHDVGVDTLLSFDAALDTALTQLTARKLVFTNSPIEHAERVLRAMGIAHHFDRVFDLRYFQFIGKPEPSCYDRILAEIGVAGHEVALIEDTSHNLAPAKALDMTTVLICHEPQQCPAADYHVSSVLEAIDVIQPLTAESPAPRRRSRTARRMPQTSATQPQSPHNPA